MSEQLHLDLEVQPARPVTGQLRELPGETWEDIFGLDTPERSEEDE
jgi:hypothetical protein